MKSGKIIHLAFLALLLQIFAAAQAAATTIDPQIIIDKLNNLTAKINFEFSRELKDQGVTENFREEYNYRFTLGSDKKLSIDFEERVRLTANGEFIRRSELKGNIAIVPQKLRSDPVSIDKNGVINIICQDELQDKCITRSAHIRVYDNQDTVIMKREFESLPAGRFVIKGSVDDLRNLIIANLKELFNALGNKET